MNLEKEFIENPLTTYLLLLSKVTAKDFFSYSEKKKVLLGSYILVSLDLTDMFLSSVGDFAQEPIKKSINQ